MHPLPTYYRRDYLVHLLLNKEREEVYSHFPEDTHHVLDSPYYEAMYYRENLAHFSCLEAIYTRPNSIETKEMVKEVEFDSSNNFSSLLKRIQAEGAVKRTTPL